LAEKKNLKRNIAVMGGVSLPFILAMAFATDVLLLIMSLSFFFFTFALQPMLNTVTAHYTTLEMRGTAFGIYFFAAFGLGSMAASFAGFIAQNFGLPWVFIGLSATNLILILLSVMLMKARNPLEAMGLAGGQK